MSNSKPVQIYKLENKKYKVNLKAINSILDKVGNRQVAIYSINGPLRDGKSFMLGFFLRYLICKGEGDWINYDLKSTFSFKGGSKRETVGIFMWSDPFILNRNGQEIALLLMDTQGVFDNQTTTKENAIVFALSTLLSSFIIYNLKEKISEDVLQFLQYFAGYAKLADNEQEDETFQKLLFLVRDWQKPDYEYGYYDDEHSINGRNFKEDFLNAHNDQPMEVKFVHNMILSTFKDVSVYLMPHPGPEVARNSNFDTNKIDPDFLIHLKKFVPLMLDSNGIVEKKIGGRSLTGNELKLYVERWSKILKNDELPNAVTFFEAAADLQHEMAKTAGVENYIRRMRDIVQDQYSSGVADDVFEDIHREIMAESTKLYESFRKIGGQEFDEKFRRKMFDEITNTFQYYLQQNQSNRRINEIQQTMKESYNDMIRQQEKSRKLLDDVLSENAAERAELMRKIEENENRWRIMEEEHKQEIERLKNESLQTQRQLKASRAPEGGCTIL